MKMTQTELNKILDQHELWVKDNSIWLKDRAKGERAELNDLNLSGMDFYNRDLSYINFRGSNLSGANLRNSILINAILIHATGFDIIYRKYIKCEFFVGISKKWDIITIGCITHTTLEWASYIEAGESFYEELCSSKEAYEKCIKVIKEAINYIEGV